MRKFLTSLQFRLIVGFAVILALSLSSVSVYARYAAASELDAYEAEVNAIREERLEEMVNQVLAAGGHRDRLTQLIEQAGELYGVRIAVTDEHGTIIGRTQIAPNYSFFGESIEIREGGFDRRPKDPRRFRAEQGAALLPLINNEVELGTLAFTNAGSESFVRQEPQAAAIIDDVDNFLLWSGLAAGAALSV